MKLIKSTKPTVPPISMRCTLELHKKVKCQTTCLSSSSQSSQSLVTTAPTVKLLDVRLKSHNTDCRITEHYKTNWCRRLFKKKREKDFYK